MIDARFITDAERRALVYLALGRIFRLMSCSEPGDVLEYERCRGIVLDLSEHIPPPYMPNYARERLGSLMRGD